MNTPLPNLHLHWIDGTIIIAYLLVLLGVGIYHARRSTGQRDFFLAGREIKWLAVGFSLMAALNSGIDYLMQPSAMIKFGVYTMVGSLSWLVIYPYVFHIALPLYRRLNTISVYEYLENRFDGRVRALAASIFVLWRFGWMATALYVPSLAISVATGGHISVTAMAVTLGTVVTLYTMMGGIRAVVWNDVFQFCLMFVGLAVTLVIGLREIDGGFGTIIQQFSQVGEAVQNKIPPGVSGPFSFLYIPMTLIGMLVSVVVARIGTYTSDQVMVQRFQTARNIADAKRGFLINAISDTVWMLALAFMGLVLFAFFHAKFGGLPSWASDHPDQLFPYFISSVFPIGLVGLVIAAILAASVSSIDSAMNALTSVLTVDFVERFRKQSGGSEANPPSQSMLLPRLINLGVGAVGILLAINVSRLGSLLEIGNKLINSFTGPILGIFLLGMFFRRTHSAAALIGGIGGTVVSMYVAFQSQIHGILNHWFNAGFDEHAVISFLWPSTFGLAATLFLGIAFGRLRRNRDSSATLEWTWHRVTQKKLCE